MTQAQLQTFAEERGLISIGPTIVGTWSGYPFMATLRPGRINVLNASFTYLKGPAKKQLKQTRKSMPRGCALSWTENKVVMVCSARDEQLFQLFQTGMDAVTNLLRASGTTLSGACALCKQGGCDSFALAGGGYVPVHQSCCENASNDKTARAAMNSLNGSYLTGWIGALLGGLVGAIPTILAAWLLEIISGWLCALIPLGAYYGYKLFKGKMDRTATVAAIVSSIIQVFVVEQVMFYIAVVRYFDLWLSIPDSIAFYFETMEPGDMAVDMIQPLLFVALGIFLVFGIIKRTSQNDVQDAGVMVDSLADLNGVRRVRPVQQPQWGQPVQPAQWGGQQGQWSQPRQSAPQQSAWGQPAQPAQPRWEPATAARPLVADPARSCTRPIQPGQPAQPPQPAQPAQPVQWAQPAQPVQTPPPTQWTPVTPPAQPVPPVQPQVPQWNQSAAPEQPAPEADSAPDPTAVIQAPPTIQEVEPLSAQLPDLPDLPDVPSVSSLDEK